MANLIWQKKNGVFVYFGLVLLTIRQDSYGVSKVVIYCYVKNKNKSKKLPLTIL